MRSESGCSSANLLCVGRCRTPFARPRRGRRPCPNRRTRHGDASSTRDKQAILDQYADILRLRNRLASTALEDKAWTRDALDVRNRFTFDCAEWDMANDELIRTHSNAGDNSGGG